MVSGNIIGIISKWHFSTLNPMFRLLPALPSRSPHKPLTPPHPSTTLHKNVRKVRPFRRRRRSCRFRQCRAAEGYGYLEGD